MSFFDYDGGRFNRYNYRRRFGSHGSDWLFGSSSSNDFLEGNRGDDRLYGFGGNDLLVGVDPDSSFPGFNERDYLTGGSGYDDFVLGDKNNCYYYNYPWETDAYAVITDYDDRYDQVVIEGTWDQYRFQDAYNLGTGSWSTRLIREDGRGDDIIAIFEGGRQSDLGLNLNSHDFIQMG